MTTKLISIDKEDERGVIETESINQCYSLLFAKKQDRGLSWISKEQYIRNDIKCHYSYCKVCNNNNNNNNSNNIKDDRPIIIPDIKTISDYLEVFELESVVNTHTTVILETVFRHVQYNSGPKYFDRLKKLINHSSGRVIYFTNDLNTQTLVERKKDEDQDQHTFRRIVEAVQWFTKHINNQQNNNNNKTVTTNIIMIYGGLEINETLKNQSINIMGLQEYLIKYHSKSSGAVDLYESMALMIKEKETAQQSESSVGSDNPYDRYWDDDIMAVELKSGNIVSGKIHINQFNREEAFVKINNSTVASTRNGGRNDKIMIIGKRNINRAIHGDKVGISILPESQWIDPNNESLLETEEGEKEGDDTTENDEELKILSNKELKNQSRVMTGKVVGIFQRNWRDYVATIERGAAVYSNFVFVVPLDSRIPLIRVATKNSAAFVDKRIVVRIDRWDVTSMHPTGHYVSSVGERGSLETELACLMVEHDISVRSWSKAILDSLPAAGWTVQPKDRASRRIMATTGHRVMSIDPLGSKDIDDAISLARIDGDRVIEIGVHIADVSHFVARDTPLDTEARRRGTTIYLPDRRYDMLPAILSEDLCSLWGGRERCAMSVVWRMERDAQTGVYSIIDTWFGRTIINSCGEFHYQLAQDIIDGKVVDGKDKDEDVTNGGKGAGYRNRVHGDVKITQVRKDMLLLRDVYRQLRARRQEAGALDLESIEVRFTFDDATKTPDRIVLKSDLEVHALVAEYMILANSAVGTRIHAHHPGAALLRRHPPPNPLGFQSIRQLFDMCGFKFEAGSNAELAKSLARAVVEGDPLAQQIIKLKTVNVVSEAVYFSTGSFNVDEYYHYGLALGKYTHFTSPIRRYADIIVHRQLWDAITSKQADQDDYAMSSLADHLNLRHRASKTLQREATQMFQSLYFHNHPKKNVEAIITDIRSNGVIVLIPEFGLRDRVYIMDKDNKPILPRDDLEYKKFDITIVKFNETNVQYFTSFGDGNGEKPSLQLSIFDHIVVDIHTMENDYHLPPVKLEFVKIIKPSKKNTYISGKEMTKNHLLQQIKQDEQSKNQDKDIIEKSLSNPYGFKLTEKNDQDELSNNNNNNLSMYDLIIKIENNKSTRIEKKGSKINYNNGKSIDKNWNHNKQQQKDNPIKKTTKEKEKEKEIEKEREKDYNSKVLRLWSMNEKQSKDYRTKADQHLRDQISQQYKKQRQQMLQQRQQQQQEDDGQQQQEDDDYDYEYQQDMNEKIAPNLTVKDKYGDLINRAEQSHLKAMRDLSLSKRKFN